MTESSPQLKFGTVKLQQLEARNMADVFAQELKTILGDTGS